MESPLRQMISRFGAGERHLRRLTWQLGRTPAEARKIGGALARNRLLLLLPCHRVRGADGSLTGYAGGLTAKRALLDLESADLVLPLGG